MKLKIVVHIALGFVVTWTVFDLVSGDGVVKALALLLPIGVLHELAHLALIKAFRLKYEAMVSGLYVGFRVAFRSVGQLLATSTAPQIITFSLMLLYLLTGDAVALALALLHVAISVEDIAKALRYLAGYLVLGYLA